MLRGIFDRLQEARQSRALVRIERNKLERGWMDGRVAAVGPQLLALHLVDDSIVYNGFTVVRLKDLTALHVPAPYAGFMERALKLRKLRAPRSTWLDVASIESVVQTAARKFPLVTVYQETMDPDSCLIGVPSDIDARMMRLRLVDPNADLGPDEAVALRHVTRVDFGGGYEDALWQVLSERNPPDRRAADA